ncbi:hypothetical protein [Salipaludibacillus sp. CF4.18]|uniref:hypothetical protein n=1 Tax=Salipaludibacillus sp. CF4.18 TaxID=3373081 RepID=UPI003EE78AEE
MIAWLNLTKKELRLGLPAFIMPIVAFFIIVAISAYFGNRYGFLGETITAVAFAATAIQVFYLVYYFIHSLSTEKKKMHLWLHNPMPAYKLILAKLVAAITTMAVTFIITGTTFLLALNSTKIIPIEIPWTDVIELGFLGSIHLLLLAINFAVLFLFFWMIFLLFTRTLGNFASFALTFLLFIVLNGFLYGWVTSSALYDTLTMWGSINLGDILSSASVNFNLEMGADITGETSELIIYLGTYLFDAILAVILFFASCWILDRKVEV